MFAKRGSSGDQKIELHPQQRRQGKQCNPGSLQGQGLIRCQAKAGQDALRELGHALVTTRQQIKWCRIQSIEREIADGEPTAAFIQPQHPYAGVQSHPGDGEAPDGRGPARDHLAKRDGRTQGESPEEAQAAKDQQPSNQGDARRSLRNTGRRLTLEKLLLGAGRGSAAGVRRKSPTSISSPSSRLPRDPSKATTAAKLTPAERRIELASVLMRLDYQKMATSGQCRGSFPVPALRKGRLPACCPALKSQP